LLASSADPASSDPPVEPARHPAPHAREQIVRVVNADAPDGCIWVHVSEHSLPLLLLHASSHASSASQSVPVPHAACAPGQLVARHVLHAPAAAASLFDPSPAASLLEPPPPAASWCALASSEPPHDSHAPKP
jgi:hypothetical protein